MTARYLPQPQALR